MRTGSKSAWVAASLLLGVSVAVGAQDAAPAKPMPAEIQPLTAKSLLLDVTRAGERVVAVGERGAIIVSNDGAQWTQVPVPVRSALTSVAFADAQNGWAAGHDAAIVHTTDGGRNWTLQNFDPALEKPVLDLLVLDARHVLAVGAYGLLLESRDAGASWTPIDVSGFNPEEFHFNAITQLANGDLYIAGEQGLMALSTDGGASWKAQTSPYEGSYFGVLPHGAKGAIVFGLRGNVYVTDDARSASWKRLDSGTVASLFGGALKPAGGAVLVGLNGVILDVDAGGSVRASRTPAGTPLSAVLVDATRVLAVGESGAQRISLNSAP